MRPILALALLVLSCDRDPPPPKPEPPRAAEPAPVKLTEPTLAEKMRAASQLSEVIPIVQPLMGDHVGVESSAPAILLALWSTLPPAGSVWRSLSSMPDHKRLEIEKDIEPFRGKKLCTRGSIAQISTDRSLAKPVYYGVLSSGWSGIIRFVTGGSTEGLVAGSPASFCGIVVGMHSYETQRGGSMSGIEVAGLFDLPANR